ncbi:MAG: alginate export porin [Acidobacteria bacterium]|nr:alginate export porin [Acidobacteriota bacterium]
MAIANVWSAQPTNRRLRTAAAGVVRSTALAVALGSALPAVAAEVDIDRREGVPADASPVRGDIGGVSPRGGDRATALQTAALPEKSPGSELPVKEHIPPDMSPRLFAQFQLPSAEGGQPSTQQLQKYLPYQYFIGTDPEMVFRNNDDLDSRTKDKSIFWLPSLSGILTYRPYAWLETTVELQLEKEFRVHEEPQPVATPRHSSFLLDQFNFTFKDFTAPFEISVGRKGYEDERRSLLDGSMDGVSVLLRQGRFTGLALLGRAARWSWDMSRHNVQAQDRINTFYSYGDYRVSEDAKLAGYYIIRSDRSGVEGAPHTVGARVFGTPSADVNYWADVAYQGGRDALGTQIQASAYDVGVTRRFFDLPLNPNFTLGWAMGTGDADPANNVNNAFQPTGLGSNERRFAGIRQFRAFGETFDPDLSNVKIQTVGFGIRPDPQVSIDLVWHGYRLHKQHGIFQSSLTAEPGQVDGHLRRDLGTEWDLVLNFNNFLGVRRLFFDVRVGWFRPGKAYIKNDGTDEDPILRYPDKAVSGIIILQW